MIKTILSLPKTVWLIGFISFLNDAASEMIYPLMPIYLATVMMVSPKSLGLIEGIAEATSSIFKLISGLIVDRTKKVKRWIVLGYILAGISRPLIAFANSWLWIIAIRFTDRLGKGLRSSPRDALLAETVPENLRGLTYGLHRSMDNAGAVIGPIIAAFLLSTGMPIKEIFLWALLPALIAVILAMCIWEAPEESKVIKSSFSWSLSGLPTDFKRYLLVSGIFALGNSSDMFLLLRAKEMGVPQDQIPLLWACISLITALMGTPLSGYSDRVGRKKFILVAWLAFAFFYFCMGLPNISNYQIFMLFAIYGLFKAATEGVEKALVADMAPIGLTGTAFGWFNLVNGLMLLPASLIFGWLYESISPFYAFLFSGTCALIAFFLMVFWVKMRNLIN